MDIQVSSNFERILSHVYSKPQIIVQKMEELKVNGFYELKLLNLELKDFLSGVASEDETFSEIFNVYKNQIILSAHILRLAALFQKFLNKNSL